VVRKRDRQIYFAMLGMLRKEVLVSHALLGLMMPILLKLVCRVLTIQLQHPQVQHTRTASAMRGIQEQTAEIARHVKPTHTRM